LNINHNIAEFEKYIPTILKTFYDEESFSEEFLIAWDDGKLEGLEKHFLYDEKRNTLFKENARPILDWLRNADDEEEEEQEE